MAKRYNVDIDKLEGPIYFVRVIDEIESDYIVREVYKSRKKAEARYEELKKIYNKQEATDD